MSAKTNPGPGNSIRNNTNSGIPTGKSNIPGTRKINYNDTISELSEPPQQLVETPSSLKHDMRKAQGAKTSTLDPKTLK